MAERKLKLRLIGAALLLLASQPCSLVSAFSSSLGAVARNIIGNSPEYGCSQHRTTQQKLGLSCLKSRKTFSEWQRRTSLYATDVSRTSLDATLLSTNNTATSSGNTRESSVEKVDLSSEIDALSTPKTSIISDDESNNVPTYRQLALFVSTTIFIWLSEPLLSLVDTTVVAWAQRDTAVVQLAALGPATTLCDSLLYSTSFLAIATTNQIAKHLAVRDYGQLQRTTRHVMTVAAVLGGVCMAVVAGAGPQLLRQMAGRAASPELLHHAVRYTYIRTAVALASVWNTVSQSFLLATLDTRTPAMAVLAASVINVLGDLALSPRWGVQGAAVATAASTVASATILLRAVRKQMKQWKQRDQEHEEQSPSKDADDNHKQTSANVASFAERENRSDRIQMFAWPGRKDLWNLVSLAGPISFVIWSKVACYGAMTLRCTDFGVIPLATHSIMMRIFFFFSSFGDSVSQAAQSFLPSTLYPKIKRKQFNQVFQKLFIIATTIGVVNSQVSMGILKYLGKFLTSDAAIVQLMKEQTFCFGLSLLCHPLIIALEGVVIASRDFRTLIRTYTVTLALHFGILKFASASFPAVWRAFVLFQGIRLVNFSARVWKRQRQMRVEQNEGGKELSQTPRL